MSWTRPRVAIVAHNLKRGVLIIDWLDDVGYDMLFQFFQEVRIGRNATCIIYIHTTVFEIGEALDGEAKHLTMHQVRLSQMYNERKSLLCNPTLYY